MAQLVYATTDSDFAERALAALGAADIPCYRVGRSCADGVQSAVNLYIERASDYAEANRILISLGAAVERQPPAWLIGFIMLLAALGALGVALGGSG